MAEAEGQGVRSTASASWLVRRQRSAAQHSGRRGRGQPRTAAGRCAVTRCSATHHGDAKKGQDEAKENENKTKGHSEISTNQQFSNKPIQIAGRSVAISHIRCSLCRAYLRYSLFVCSNINCLASTKTRAQYGGQLMRSRVRTTEQRGSKIRHCARPTHTPCRRRQCSNKRAIAVSVLFVPYCSSSLCHGPTVMREWFVSISLTVHVRNE